ncbi:porin, partial [Oleiphilus sp. HI0132]
LAAKYAMDNLELAFAYSMGREEAGVEAEDTIGLGATYSMDDITVMLGYESMSDTVDYIGLQGMYTMGQNQFALGYGMKSYDGAEDEATIALQALHNVTDHLFVALEYTTSTDLGGVDGADVDVLAIGANYSF